MKYYGAAAGIPLHLRHFHVLKHCCATHLLSKGFGVVRVQDWIGHANIQSTMEYAKVTNARRDDGGFMGGLGHNCPRKMLKRKPYNWAD